MARIRRLLAASDLSPGSARALARAVELAARHGARLTVLHVVGDGGGPGAPPLLEARVRAAQADLRLEVDPLLLRYRRPAPPEVEIRVVPGLDFERILDEARATEADLVVLGAHGAHRVRDLFAGTTGEKVLRLGDRPVLVVKRVPRHAYRRVLVPVDFSGASRLALETALDIAGEASVRVLHVPDLELEPALRGVGATPDDLEAYRRERVAAGRADLAGFLEENRDLTASAEAGGRFETLVEGGRPAAVIPDVARRVRADLVVVGTRGRTASPRLLLGSVAQHVLRDVRCDVLCVRPAPAEPWRPAAA